MKKSERKREMKLTLPRPGPGLASHAHRRASSWLASRPRPGPPCASGPGVAARRCLSHAGGSAPPHARTQLRPRRRLPRPTPLHQQLASAPAVPCHGQQFKTHEEKRETYLRDAQRRRRTRPPPPRHEPRAPLAPPAPPATEPGRKDAESRSEVPHASRQDG